MESNIESKTSSATLGVFKGMGTAVCVILLIGLAIFIGLQSPLNPDSIHYPSSASAHYIYTGSQIAEGIMPYRDGFTSVGPLVFIINMAGYLLNGTTGIWWLEILFLTAALLTLFAALVRPVGSLAAFLVCVLLGGLVAGSLEGGNHLEEYALLFQAVGLAGVLDYFKRRRLTLVSVYMIGASAALTLCLKPSIVVFWLPFFLVIVVMIFWREGVGLAFTRMIALLLSAVIIFVMIVPWLYITNSLNSCLDQMAYFYLESLKLIPKQARLDALAYYSSQMPFILIVLISLLAIVQLSIQKLRRRARYKKAAESLLANYAKTAVDVVDVAGAPGTAVMDGAAVGVAAAAAGAAGATDAAGAVDGATGVAGAVDGVDANPAVGVGAADGAGLAASATAGSAGVDANAVDGGDANALDANAAASADAGLDANAADGGYAEGLDANAAGTAAANAANAAPAAASAAGTVATAAANAAGTVGAAAVAAADTGGSATDADGSATAAAGGADTGGDNNAAGTVGAEGSTAAGTAAAALAITDTSEDKGAGVDGSQAAEAAAGNGNGNGADVKDEKAVAAKGNGKKPRGSRRGSKKPDEIDAKDDEPITNGDDAADFETDEDRLRDEIEVQEEYIQLRIEQVARIEPGIGGTRAKEPREAEASAEKPPTLYISATRIEQESEPATETPAAAKEPASENASTNMSSAAATEAPAAGATAEDSSTGEEAFAATELTAPTAATAPSATPEVVAPTAPPATPAVEGQDAQTVVDLRAQEDQAQAQLPFGRNTMTIIVTNLFAAMLTFAAMTLAGQQQDHLMVQGLVCLALPLAYVIRQFTKAISQRAVIGIIAGAAMVAILFVVLALPGLSKSYDTAEFHKTSTPELEQQNQLVEKIKEYSIVGEPMVVFGDDCWVYTAAGSYSATRYAVQHFNADFRPDLNDDFYRQVGVAATTTDEMLLAGRVEGGRVERYPSIGEYEMIFSNDRFVLYHRIPPPA